jgi:HEAT repeat protein
MNPAPVSVLHGMSSAVLLFSLVSGISFIDSVKNVFSSGKSIAKMKDAHDIGGLVRLLNHSDPDIQYHAVEALGEIGDAGAVEPLIAVLNHEEMSGVRWKTAESLVKIGKPSVEPLISTLQHPDGDVRWKAAVALGEIGDPRAIEPLIAQLSDTDRFVKSRAAQALGMIGAPAVHPLIQTLHDGDGNQRWGAAIALGGIKDPKAIEPLIVALADKYENVRAEAAAALASIGKPAIAPLIRFLKYSEGTGRIEVMNALGELHANDAIEPLVQMLERADEHERRAIAATLDAILTPSVVQLAKRLWTGEDHTMTKTDIKKSLQKHKEV